MKTDAIRKMQFTRRRTADSSLRFAIESRKESRLPDCLSYSVVKEPTPAKGRLICQTLPSVSSEMFPFRRTHSVWLGLLLEKNCVLRQGPRIVAASLPLVNCARDFV